MAMYNKKVDDVIMSSWAVAFKKFHGKSIDNINAGIEHTARKYAKYYQGDVEFHRDSVSVFQKCLGATVVSGLFNILVPGFFPITLALGAVTGLAGMCAHRKSGRAVRDFMANTFWKRFNREKYIAYQKGQIFERVTDRLYHMKNELKRLNPGDKADTTDMQNYLDARQAIVNQTIEASKQDIRKLRRVALDHYKDREENEQFCDDYSKMLDDYKKFEDTISSDFNQLKSQYIEASHYKKIETDSRETYREICEIANALNQHRVI